MLPCSLRYYLGGWRLWIGFCASQSWHVGSPFLAQFLDFTVSLVEGCKANRGRRRSAVSGISGMSLLQLDSPLYHVLVPSFQAGKSFFLKRFFSSRAYKAIL